MTGPAAPAPMAEPGCPLPLPPANLRFMSENDQQLLEVGDELAGLLVAHGLRAGSVVLDIGCGYGRLALGILHSTDHRGPYLGFDILRKQIAWCSRTITPDFPQMRFKHLDIRNDRYNPTGSIDAARTAFPARSASTDLCALFSVFTHLYRPDIERYLGEIHRVLRPGGRAVTTWFLFDEARLPAITGPTATYPMVHVLDDVTRYTAEGDPLRAIAFQEDAVRAMIREAGLEIVSVEHGSWAGQPGRTFQDLVVLGRAVTDVTVDPEPPGPSVPERLRAVAQRVTAGVVVARRRGVRMARRALRRGTASGRSGPGR